MEQEKSKVYYKDVVKLGFKQTQVNDDVYFDHHGYPYIIFELKLSKHVYLSWDQATMTAELVRLRKPAREGSIASRLEVGRRSLYQLVNFYKGTSHEMDY